MHLLSRLNRIHIPRRALGACVSVFVASSDHDGDTRHDQVVYCEVKEVLRVAPESHDCHSRPLVIGLHPVQAVDDLHGIQCPCLLHTSCMTSSSGSKWYWGQVSVDPAAAPWVYCLTDARALPPRCMHLQDLVMAFFCSVMYTVATDAGHACDARHVLASVNM